MIEIKGRLELKNKYFTKEKPPAILVKRYRGNEIKIKN